MSGSLTVTPGERGLVRVFALSMTDAEAQALRANEGTGDAGAPSPQATALGVTSLDTQYTEVFPVADLDRLRLSGYLVEGNGVDPKSLEGHREKLDALDGWVMLVYSSAFAGQSVELSPASSLTHIGTYAEPGVDWSERVDLQSEAATNPDFQVPPPKKVPSEAAMSGRVAMIALVVIALITILVVALAG